MFGPRTRVLTRTIWCTSSIALLAVTQLQSPWEPRASEVVKDLETRNRVIGVEMKICVVEEWRADFTVVFVEEWRAKMKVAVVEEWRA